ncbi:hypothetical protein Bca101_066521 [Brassica carinata]
MVMESEKPHKKVRRTRSSKATSLPVDLISEILLRLPVKSAVKFRCVSKVWSSVTTRPSFITSFAARSNPHLIILCKNKAKSFFLSIPQIHDSDHKPQLVDSYVKETCSFEFPVSVHGMICSISISSLVSELTLQIWNPTMRGRTVTLPYPNRDWSDTTAFLGYDPIDGTYKVLSMSSYPRARGDNQPRVLTLTGDHKESWRIIHEIAEHVPYSPRHYIINGVMYYVASLKSEDTDNILVSFHVRSEKMSIIKVPWDQYYLRGAKIFPVLYHGKLACATSQATDIIIWLLEDAEKHEWSYQNFHLPFPTYDPISESCFHLKGVNDAGELIYLPNILVDSVHILYYDPNTDSYRRVVVEGLAGDQFRRRNGIGDKVQHVTKEKTGPVPNEAF